MMHIRPYDGQDEQELIALWQLTMPYDVIDAQQFRTKVLLDPNFRQPNLPVAVQDGTIIGFILCLTRQVPLFLDGIDPDTAWITAFGVHPDYRNQGVATELFDYIFTKLRAENRHILDISPYVPNYFVPGIDRDAYSETITFLETKLQFNTLYHAISMDANLTNFHIPDDIQSLIIQREKDDQLTIRTVTSADIPELMLFIVDHFGWDWYRHVQSYLLEYFGGNPHHICVLVARLGGEVVGFCQQSHQRFGPFGVRPDCRGRGIGKILLFKCLQAMRAKSIYYSYFLWTDEKAARLYSSAGFKRRREFSVMRKTLD